MSLPIGIDIDALTLGSPWLIDRSIVKAHTRVDADDDDALLAVYLQAAIGWAESATQRVIYRRACRVMFSGFPLYDPIRLPCGKTQSVTSIVYSSGGQNLTLTGPSSGSPAGTDYQEDLRADSGGILMPVQGAAWPDTDSDVPAPVTITFTAGWDAADVPMELQYAIIFAVADMYDARAPEGMDLGNVGERLTARESLISAWRLTRVY